MVFMKGFVTGALVTAGTIFAAAAVSVLRENRQAMENIRGLNVPDDETVGRDTNESDD